MRAGNVTPPLNMLIGDEREVVGFVHPDGTRQPVPTYAASGAVEFADGTPGLTPEQVTATQALVSGGGLQALSDNAAAILALIGVSLGGSTYFVGDYVASGYVN